MGEPIEKSSIAGLDDHLLTPKQREFLSAYSRCGRIGQAARIARTHRSTHLVWLRESEEFRRAFMLMQETMGQAAEDAVVQRGIHGIKRLVLFQGKPVRVNGQPLYQIEYSDTLLLAVLRRFKPEYRERMGVEHPGSVDVVERLQAARARLIQLGKARGSA